MGPEFVDLIDHEKIGKLLESFHEALGAPSAIMDLDGRVIVKSRWSRICSAFHRRGETSCRKCIESAMLANELMRGKPYALYTCLNGMQHAASPIVLEGKHFANILIGQFLIETPDRAFFSRQADLYGYEKSAYLEALAEVPIIKPEVLSFTLSFLTSFTEMLAGLGMKNLRHLQTEKELKDARDALQIKNEELSASEEELRTQNDELIASREQIEILARIPSESPHLVMRIATDGEVLYANEAASRLLQFRPGRKAELPPSWLEIVNEASRTGASVKPDITVGDSVFAITVVPLVENGYVNIYGQDITERTLMEEKLLRAKQEWERTFDTVPDLIAIIDPQHRIVRANREMARRTGLTPHQCEGLFCHRCVHGSSDVPGFCPHSQTLQDGLEHMAEVNDEHLGGHFLVSTTPLRDERGNVVGSVHVARDITERKHMEEELRRSRDELETRVRERTADLAKAVARLEMINQELQEFAFAASHDLQEPLRKIQNFCDLVLRSNRDRVDEKGQDYLSRIQNAAARMQQLLKDLLSYSQVISQPDPFTEVDLGAIAAEAADVFELKIRELQGEIEISDLPVIEADASQMTRLFQNLIGNAVKYRRQESPLVRIYGEKERAYCRIFVEDNGIGFDERYLDRIFSPFQRLHAGNKYPGTGMGLAICRKIVERHGGSITANSAPGRGSTFIITMPIKQK